MNIHIIVDFMHIYYKYHFQLKAGKLKKLSAPIEWNGTTINKDTTMIFYPIRDIESIRKRMESLGHTVTLSICFDSPSRRQDTLSESKEEYKADRVNKLSEEDYMDIDFIRKTLNDCGYNTYKVDGYEADDIVNFLVKEYKDTFDYSVIYTNDKDLLVNIDEKVGVMRFKIYTGYEAIDISNYESKIEQEFKTFIPYNAIGFYLSTVGDKADNIKGIHGFGNAAFKKLLTKISANNDINWKECGNYDKLAKVITLCKEHLTDEQYNQMYNSFLLVQNMAIDSELIHEPSSKSSRELREQVYTQYRMISLIP